MEADFGSRLCELRKGSAWTQKELAIKLGVHITTIKNWENSNCSPDAKNICAIADLFHITTDSLLGRDNTEVISIPDLTKRERNQLFHIIQAYIDTRHN